MKQTQRFIFYMLLAVLLNISCKKQSPVEEIKKSEKELLSFYLDKNNNQNYLSQTIIGLIDGNEIKITLSADVDASALVATFTHSGEKVFIGSIQQETGVTVNDFTKTVIYTVVAEDGSKKDYTLNINRLPSQLVKIPHIYIDTEGRVDIVEKKTYVQAEIYIDGGINFEDLPRVPASIRGRGNSTWGMPKKPYRIKLDSKASVLGLPAEKNWVLLANYIDHSLMCNAFAMKTGQLLDMPFTHHMIPVDVTLNGKLLGNYMLTEHKEVTENRINIGKDGWLIELDTYYDQPPWQFISKVFSLPVMIQFPELDKMDESEALIKLNTIKEDFENLEALVADDSFPENNYLDFFDSEAFVKYMIVYYLTANEEINHPKSTYIYKMKNEKYCMGPIWDFDWAFGYEGTGTHFVNPERPLFWNKNSKGTLFFNRFMQDPEIKNLFREEWNKFKSEKLQDLTEYIEWYAEQIEESHSVNYAIWKQGKDDVYYYLNRMLPWIEARVSYIDLLFNN